jgi:hypothetical protein
MERLLKKKQPEQMQKVLESKKFPLTRFPLICTIFERITTTEEKSKSQPTAQKIYLRSVTVLK